VQTTTSAPPTLPPPTDCHLEFSPAHAMHDAIDTTCMPCTPNTAQMQHEKTRVYFFPCHSRLYKQPLPRTLDRITVHNTVCTTFCSVTSCADCLCVCMYSAVLCFGVACESAWRPRCAQLCSDLVPSLRPTHDHHHHLVPAVAFQFQQSSHFVQPPHFESCCLL
jgi:hypothetical protein